ncbi:MAG: hypothetical protein V1772_10800, partial [Chloroflexota bacterium]
PDAGAAAPEGAAPPSSAGAVLADMRQRSADRNREMAARVNAYLDPVTVDYTRDVLPLTPAGNATERHLLIAYDRAARERYPRRADLVGYWAAKLGLDPAAVDAFLGDAPAPHDVVRAKLMKRGGVGYMPPEADTFPRFDAVNAMIRACGAIPVYGFVDGTSSGEQRLGEMLAFLVAQGIGALCVVPERNWHLDDPAERQRKMALFYAALAVARALDLPILAGTEMNRAGQPLIDDFDAAPMQPLCAELVDGGDWLYGHTLLQRALGLGEGSAWARGHLPERRARNAFYAQVGRAVPPDGDGIARLRGLDAATLDPGGLLARVAG